LPSAPWVLARLLASVESNIQEPPEPPQPLEEPRRGGWRRTGVRRGLLLLRAERWQHAYRAFRRAEARAQRDPRIGFGLGITLFYLGHSEASEAYLRASLDQLEEPFHSEALAALGKCDLELARPAAAILELRRALGRGAQAPENYYALGLAFLRQGRTRLARKAFQGCVSPGFVRERFRRLQTNK
jgi:tetratricopeptide (TPR) repeat protein